MERIENSDLEKSVLFIYKNEKISVRKLAKIHNISTSLVSRILKENSLYKFKNNIEIKTRIFVPDCGKKFVAICKKTNKEFNDFNNISGVLTTHVFQLNKDYILPSKFKRREYFKKTGLYWFEEFFEIVQIKIKDKKKCKYCNWETNDIEIKVEHIQHT